MAVLTVRNVPDEVHRALRVRAAGHGRSAEAEVREILSAALVPSQRLLLGDALASLGRDLALTDDDVAALDAGRDRTPAEAPKPPTPSTCRVCRSRNCCSASGPCPSERGRTGWRRRSTGCSRCSPVGCSPSTRTRRAGMRTWPLPPAPSAGPCRQWTATSPRPHPPPASPPPPLTSRTSATPASS